MNFLCQKCSWVQMLRSWHDASQKKDESNDINGAPKNKTEGNQKADHAFWDGWVPSELYSLFGIFDTKKDVLNASSQNQGNALGFGTFQVTAQTRTNKMDIIRIPLTSVSDNHRSMCNKNRKKPYIYVWKDIFFFSDVPWALKDLHFGFVLACSFFFTGVFWILLRESSIGISACW